jgi:D-glycero-D-manno-heptose 1,7-bisphosphate phosphatase
MKAAPTHDRAVFLDRDGVIIEDTNLLTKTSEIRVLPGVPEALNRLRNAGFRLIVVSNQPVVARGLATEADVERINGEINHQLATGNGVALDQFYFCPHHPKATLPAYRVNCDCRKPQPGLILQGAKDHHLDLSSSFMVGDRITDIIAGAKAGCRTIMVQTGQHAAEPIQTAEPIDISIRPDWTCTDLTEAVDWILKHS